MKLKKLIVSVVFLFCLTGCNSNSHFGVYSFQLGKNHGTHFGISLNLTSDEHYPESNNKEPRDSGHIFYLTADVNMPSNDQLDLENTNFDNDEAVETQGLIKRDIYTISINGFYSIKDTRLDFDIRNFDGVGLDEELEEILNSLLPYLFIAKISNNVVGITIPVSLNDLEKQVTWLQNPQNIGTLPSEDSPYYYQTVTVTLMKQ